MIKYLERGYMFENLTKALNVYNYFSIYGKEVERNVYIGFIEFAVIDEQTNQFKNKYKSEIMAENIFDFFAQLENSLGGEADFKEIRKIFYGLNAIDEFQINNFDECQLFSKSKKYVYQERLIDHDCDFESYIQEMHNQISNPFPEKYKPIEKYDLSL